mmetsp:Transcript_16521/g.44378  ORF Transcript_16521/g.44378 Transcript_16521/m.44378 type:complete len:246 (+) Transcript_16521:144-881(+)
MCEKMLSWVHNCTKGSSEWDLLELYCGNGNFSLAVAENFRKVLATELSKVSVDAAQWNIEANKIDNVKIVKISAEDLTEAMESGQEFQRLKAQGVDLKDYDCRTVLVDPPRAGVGRSTCEMLQKFDNIVYISCNPETLKENLKLLVETHEISRAAFFDQFPFTHHIEVGVFLKKIAIGQPKSNDLDEGSVAQLAEGGPAQQAEGSAAEQAEGSTEQPRKRPVSPSAGTSSPLRPKVDSGSKLEDE